MVHGNPIVPCPSAASRPGRQPAGSRRNASSTDLVAGFLRIMGLWEVEATTARILLRSPPKRTFFKWKAGACLVGGAPHVEAMVSDAE